MERIYKAEYVCDYVVRVTFFDGEVREYDVENYYMSDACHDRFVEYASRLGGLGNLSVNNLRTKVDLGEGFLVNADAIKRYGLLVGRVYIDDINIRVAKAVQNMRESKGLTQKDIEERTGIHQAEISKIERGIGNPSLLTLARIAESAEHRMKLEFIDKGIRRDVPMCDSAAPYLEVGKYQGEFTIADMEAIPEDIRCELIEGCIYECATPSTIHQKLILRMALTIQNYIDKRKEACEVYLAPQGLVFEEDDSNFFEPDLMIICDKDKIKSRWILGAPDFVLEVISKSNAKQDYHLKSEVYYKKGVREYWILDPERKRLTVYLGDEDWMPRVYPLEGKVGLHIYDGKLAIDLKKMAEIISQYHEENS